MIMKNFLLVFFIPLSILGQSVNLIEKSPDYYMWNNVVSAGFSSGSVEYPSLAFGPDSLPWVAFADFGNSGKASVIKLIGNKWVYVGTPGFSSGVTGYTCLAFSSSGIPYIAFQDYGYGRRTTVMKFADTSWVAVGNPGFSTGVVKDVSIAISHTGEPYVVYTDCTYWGPPVIKKFNGIKWVNVGTPNIGDRVTETKIAFNQEDQPYVLFKDGEEETTVIKFDGINWLTVGSPDFSTNVTEYLSLAFGPDNKPYVAFDDYVYGTLLKASVMKFDGTNWVYVGQPGFSTGEPSFTSLAFNSLGEPHLAYQDGFNGKATVMKFDGVNWVNVGTPQFSAGEADYLSLAISKDGTPILAFTDYGNSQKLTVMKYDSLHLEIQPDSILLDWVKDSYDTVLIKSNAQWSLQTSWPVWLGKTKTSGYGNDTVIFYSTQANSDNFQHYATIDVEYPLLDSISFTVGQKGKPSGVAESKSGDIIIFPNPTSGIITISSQIPMTSVKILNSFGTRLKEYILNSKQLIIDFSSFQRGIYFLKINNHDQVITRKIIYQ